MNAFAVAFLISLFSFTALAQEIQIVDVRRNIPLSDEEPVYKDFYLNAGDGSGLKKNLVVTAVRKWTVRDSVGATSIGDVEVPVGQLKIIAVYGKVAIAREHKLLSRDDHPMLEQTGLMVGDRIDIKGSFVDNSSPKRETASEAKPAVEAPAAPTASIAPPASTPVAALVVIQEAAKVEAPSAEQLPSDKH